MEEPEAQTPSAPQPQPEPAGTGPAAPCPPCAPPEEKSAFPSHFARLFFGVITLLVLYYSYLIIKPYLLDIFMALVLFFTARPLYLALCRGLGQRKALASAITCLILLLVILIPLFSLMSIIATQALEFSSQVTKGMQGGHLWPWIAAKIEAFKAYLVHLDLPLPPGEIDLAQIVQTVVTKASAFIYTNAIGLIKGFTYFFFDLLLVLFIAFFMFLQGDDFIAELHEALSPGSGSQRRDSSGDGSHHQGHPVGHGHRRLGPGVPGRGGFPDLRTAPAGLLGHGDDPGLGDPPGGQRPHLGAGRHLPPFYRPHRHRRGPDHLGRGGGERHRQRFKAHPGERRRLTPPASSSSFPSWGASPTSA